MSRFYDALFLASTGGAQKGGASFYDAMFGKAIGGGSGNTKTVTGALVTITDAIADNAFSAVIAKIVSSSGVTSAKVYRVGTNLLKTKNGTYTLTGRTLTANNSEITCDVTGGSGSAILVSSGVFDTSYYLPAGTYYFEAGVVSVVGQKFGSPFLRMIGTNGTTYEKGEGVFTLPVAARIDTIRDNITHTWASGNSYVIKPKITLAADEPFAPFSGDTYSLSWSGTAGSVTDGEINFTTGVLTVGENTYQLTPTEIKALSGANNIWAETGDVTVTYLAQV